ncbi:hypothetical protein ABIE24_000905 [Mycetocola sp. 2940]
MDVTTQAPTGAAKRRYIQILIAVVLGYGLASSLLLFALREPRAPLGWILLGGWLVLFAVGLVVAWKGYKKLLRGAAAATTGPPGDGPNERTPTPSSTSTETHTRDPS